MPVAQSSEPLGNSFECGIEALLRWAGVSLVTLAGIFLVSTAISRGWIGPELQLLGAALGGVVMLGAAVYTNRNRAPWALAFGSGGTLVLAASTLATHHWLDLIGPAPAVWLFALAMGTAMAVALTVRLEALATLTAIVTMVAPLDTLDALGTGHVVLWISGAIVLSSALGLFTSWPGPRLLAGWSGALLLLMYTSIEVVDGAARSLTVTAAALVAATLWVGAALALRSPSGPGRWGSFDVEPIDARMSAVVPAWTWAMFVAALPSEPALGAGVIAILTALAFGMLAATARTEIPHAVTMSTLLGSAALLTTGFVLELDGPALLTALTGQACVSYELGRRLRDRALRIGGIVVGVAASALAVVTMLAAVDLQGFATVGDAAATLLVVGLWAALAFTLRRTTSESTFDLVYAGAWAGFMLWIVAALLGAPQGLMLISGAWAALACLGLVRGITARDALVRNVALWTLAVTLCKLVVVDMAEVDVFWRVGLFFAVGVGLITLGMRIPALAGEVIEPAEAEIRSPQ